MKAARWHGKRDIRVEIVPDPAPGPGDVVLRVDWCGICGTDVDEYLTGPHWVPTTPNPLTGRQAPLTLGHEFCGEVVATGRDVRGLKVGDRVAPDTLISCGHCFWCKRHQVQLCESLAGLGLMADGGLAEFCVAPQEMCVQLPESLGSDHAALAETLSVGVHAFRRGRLTAGEQVAVVGAGAVGLCALQAALHGGARRAIIIEPDAQRRQIALQLGASAAINPTEDGWQEVLREATSGIGPDITVECGGSLASANVALAAPRKGGRLVLVGFPAQLVTLDFAAIAAREVEIIGSLAHVYDEDFAAAVDLLGSGRVRVAPIITHRVGLGDVVEKGFERLAARDRSAIKILVSPGMASC